MGPCLCGDTQCPSCGPAQGNWKCPICGEWADNGCDHIDDDGNLKQEFQAEAEERNRLECEADEAYAQDLERAELMVERAELREQLDSGLDESKASRLNARIDQIERDLGLTSSQ